MFNSLNYNDNPANAAHNVCSLTYLHNLIAFSHLPLSHDSNKSDGYGDTLYVTIAPSFLRI